MRCGEFRNTPWGAPALMVQCDGSVTFAVLYLAHKNTATNHIQHNTDQEAIIMKKSIIIKSLLNAVISYFVVALVLTLFKGVPFAQALTAPYTIVLGISALVGSALGFAIKASK